jgi:type I restriction enzyme S subunit
MNKNKLPKDWKWVKLGDLTQKINKVKRKEVLEEGALIYLDIGGIDNTLNKIVTFKNYLWKDAPSRAQQIVEVEDILFSTVRTYMKNIAIVDKQIYQHQIASSGFTVLRTNKETIYKYIFYLTISDIFLNPLNELQTGSSYPAVRDTDVLNQKVPLPPLETQLAIVDKIEELFSELDKGIEDLKTAQQQLKTYRQSVLKYAFEGKLTNKKVKDGVLPKGWEWKKISDISKVVRGGSPRPAGDQKYYDGDIPFLKVADLTKDNGIYLTTFKYTIKEAGLHKTRQITPNTLLLTNSGATLGVPKICMINATMNDGVAAFLELDERSNHYLYYFWVSKTLELRGINMGAGQPNLNTDLIKDYDLPYCSFEEQNLIVQEIESRLSVADKMEESIAQSLQQAEALRQSILKKAFSGELV